VILLVAIILGLAAGILSSRLRHNPWQPPSFEWASLALVAFLPQFVAFYIPGLRSNVSDQFAAVCLTTSQIGLLIFCWINRRQTYMPILAAGLLLNLIVISANGGLMPISTATASQLLPADVFQQLQVGGRFSVSSKDILLDAQVINFPWLADRFLSPDWFSYRFVFSAGDVLISLGAFLLLAIPSVTNNSLPKKENLNVNQPIE